jgi:hypothetical protein
MSKETLRRRLSMLSKNTVTATLVVAGVLTLPYVVLADPPQANDLGAVFTVVSRGPSSTVEIRLQPKAAFEAVRVEAASGVASITPPCAFAQVEVGGDYVCRVDITPKAGEASLTLNVVGERAAEAGKARVVEVRHFTLGTGQAATAHAASAKPTPGLSMTPAPSSTR